MRVSIKYFASIRESIGISYETCDSSAVTVADLRDALISRGGDYALCLARGKAVRVALNQIMSEETAPLADGCEVAFFPPVTGG